ncbi:hypothetical protein Natoc_2178 [Natronococcus occultus SP4]|uniref:Uncharacterized protein n=1 Tax=Natronococcus occultus SP4 TaxID=694430 RepID=L0K0U1_9EURY|nr:hypothetical protein Natoc_2178 [Natronococcus occultus SP4]
MSVVLIAVGWLVVLCLYLGFFIGMGVPERDRRESDLASQRRGSR